MNTKVGGPAQTEPSKKAWDMKIYHTAKRTPDRKITTWIGQDDNANAISKSFPFHPLHRLCLLMLHCYMGISNLPSAGASEITTSMPLHWSFFRGRLSRGVKVDIKHHSLTSMTMVLILATFWPIEPPNPSAKRPRHI
mmetsp:Transcript_11992/g.26164  ORF Transcript_11992/g.26164 Transcript_11992/m.26164 type:complete len:138 (+) Transcript_11992:483-896(+)